MIHYHVWFNLKPEVAEPAGLDVVAQFLTRLSAAGEATGFQLLRNLGRPPRSKLPAYHALVEFADAEALSAAMQQQAGRGIHSGPHGAVIDVVADFHVEIFTHLPAFQPALGYYGCEI
jgi:hypothetical protein